MIPAFNEADGILDVVAEAERTLAAMGLADYEIIVVDDGSTDRTAELLNDAGTAKLVRHPHNAGYGHALKTGIRAARFDTIVITDADTTYPFAAVPDLVSEYAKGFDMVVGARTGAQYRESALKGPLRVVLRWLVEFTAGRSIPDINSGLRVFGKAAVVPYFPHLSNAFSFTTSLTLSYMMTGRFVAYRDIPYAARKGKTKVRLLRDSLRALQYIVQATVYYNPLKIFLLLAALSLACSALGFLVSIYGHLMIGYILGIGGILLAFLMFATGLLAVLLKQIMDK